MSDDTGAERYWEGRWRDEAKENDRLRAELETCRSPAVRKAMDVFDAGLRIRRLEEQLAEAAAFLDRLAERIDHIRQRRSLDNGVQAAADCRAMARKLRGE